MKLCYTHKVTTRVYSELPPTCQRIHRDQETGMLQFQPRAAVTDGRREDKAKQGIMSIVLGLQEEWSWLLT